MEEPSRIVPSLRDRKAAEALTVIPAPSVLPWDQVAREPHLLDYIIILRKHQWLILTFLLTVVTVVTIASFKMKPVYLAAARVEVDKESQNMMPFPDSNSYDEFMDMENYLETQTKILQSETLALQTIKSLDLARYPEFGGGPSTTAWAHNGPAPQRPAILGAFLGRLTVKRVANSRLIEVTFEAEDPQLAAQIVNTHLQNFVEQNFRSKYDATIQASSWLSSELEGLRIKVEKSENARIAYQRANQTWQIDEKQDITTSKMADLSKAVTEAQTDVAQKEAMYRMAVSGNVDALPTAHGSEVLTELLKRKSDIDEQYAEALNQYGPNFPKVLRIAAQQKELDENLSRARKTLIESVQQEFNTARSHVELLQETLDKQRAEANDQAEKLIQYHILQHDAESDRLLYDGLLQKLKEATITVGLRSTNIRVVDPALAPGGPSRPQKARNILLAFLIGLVGGVGLALFREYLDNTVKSPDDIEALTGLPSLAVVPAMPGLNAHQGRLSRRTGEGGAPGRIELLSYAQPKSQISEAFRALRTSLLLSQAEHPPQVILVTSALPREGKTTAAVNLAVTLAQLGDRTLLMDSDLRKPGIRRALNLTLGKDVGLSSYLAGVSSLDEATIQHPTITNLSALTTGPVPPSPADLLSSHRMREAIAELRRRFKFIVIDSPPVMAATDAVILSALTDGVLLVVRSGETPKEAFTRTRDLLAAVKCRLLGVVLNAVDSSAPDYYYSYRYYPYAYGYGYGEDAEKTTKFPSGSDESDGPST
ncbi:MAG TPA: polysaccharide biosynthesis tyrosine autokinase [Candidatus Acidoferrales bacterium]|jgi:succinoglycan biosynthesis transport protein ExoP|nr:polysaccharide biosynthesis tyrosine autokinase [Candidatus Acidoferrales bacterium]